MNTEIITIIDRSGSMSSIRSDAIGGFNQFLADQKLLPGEAKMTLITFNARVTVEYAGKPLASAVPLTVDTYVPVGSTALIDAVCMALETQGKRIKDEAWAEKVVVCILTDGEENSSREYSLERMREMIGHAEKHGWQFVFLAANQDAFASAARYGMTRSVNARFAATGVGTRSAYDIMSMNVAQARAGQAPAAGQP